MLKKLLFLSVTFSCIIAQQQQICLPKPIELHPTDAVLQCLYNIPELTQFIIDNTETKSETLISKFYRQNSKIDPINYSAAQVYSIMVCALCGIIPPSSQPKGQKTKKFDIKDYYKQWLSLDNVDTTLADEYLPNLLNHLIDKDIHEGKKPVYDFVNPTVPKGMPGDLFFSILQDNKNKYSKKLASHLLVPKDYELSQSIRRYFEEKQSKIAQLPPYLIIIIDRGHVITKMTPQGPVPLFNQITAITQTIDVSPYVISGLEEAETEYELSSFIAANEPISSIAYVLHQSKWYLYNAQGNIESVDNILQNIVQGSLKIDNKAYVPWIMFYKRKESKPVTADELLIFSNNLATLQMTNAASM